MKRFIIPLILIFISVLFSNKLAAQNPIPSFNVPVVVDPTTFEEVTDTTSAANLSIGYIISSWKSKQGQGEQKLNIKAKDKNNTNTAWVRVIVYSLDNSIVYDPYDVYEGSLYELILSTEYEWGVSAINSSNECEMDVWFD